MRRIAVASSVAGLLATPLALALLPHARPTVAGSLDLLTGATLLAFIALPWAVTLTAALRGYPRFALLANALMAGFELAALIVALQHPIGTLAALIYLIKPIGQVFLALPLGALGAWGLGHRAALAAPPAPTPQ
jgi:hypothetical protein